MTTDQGDLSPHLQEFLSRLTKVKYIGSSRYMGCCPAHQDKEASLSITTGSNNCILLKCFAGCSANDIVAALGLKLSDLFPSTKGGRGGMSSGKNAAHLHRSKQPTDNKKEKVCSADCTPNAHLHKGLSLQEYAGAKKLPVDFLRGLGISDITYQESNAIRIPYYDEAGAEVSIRIRRTLEKGENEDQRFVWKKSSKPCLYGRNRGREGYVILDEGESDCHTLWFHGFPALGIPGATNWREDRDARVIEAIPQIYILIEPDQGGVAIKKWLASSSIRDRAYLVNLNGFKDPSALHIDNPDKFKERFQEAMERAIAWTDLKGAENEKAKREAWSQCSALAESGCILQRFIATLSSLGVVGEEKISKILYLSLVSRFLSRPVSNVLKGPSSGGKSFVVDRVLKFFPPSAFYALTSMSEHSLAYSDEPLKNRFLVLYEAAGLNSDLASYMLRSLLSEGCVRYETVEKTKDGLKPRLIEREGPTGVIITSTAVRLHPENETRLLSMTVSDTKEQTSKVMLALAGETPGNGIDFNQWHSLQLWLEYSEHRVVIPYAVDLAKNIPPIAVRLRRDFTAVLNLIRAHAILNQARRSRAEDGCIVAEIEDYSVVRDLVLDFISEGIGAAVPESIRETVEAIEGALQGGCAYATVAQVSQRLNLDRSAASRRISTGIAKGYLVNIENKKGKAKKIVIGDPLPEEVEVLPSPEKLGVCRCADVQEGVNTPPPPLIKGRLYEVMDDGQLTY